MYVNVEENVENLCYSYKLSWFQLIRPLTLTGTISPILAGTAIAAAKGSINFLLFCCVLIASLIVQVTINILNDYFDFKNGQDSEKWTTTKLKGKPRHHLIPIIAAFLLIIATIIGLFLAIYSSYWILLVGLVGIFAGIAYSAGPYSLSSIGLGEVIAAIFLGFVPCWLAYFIQGYLLDIKVLIVTIPFSLIIATMILSNNIRDIKKDNGFRKTLAMVIGRKKSAHLLALLLVFNYLWVILFLILGILPWSTIISFLGLPLAFKLYRCYQVKVERKDEIIGMKFASYHHWVFGLLFSFGLWVTTFF